MSGLFVGPFYVCVRVAREVEDEEKVVNKDREKSKAVSSA